MTDLICYSNNGYALRYVSTGYQTQAGEVLFNDIPTSDQLIAAFPNYLKTAANNVVNGQISDLESEVTTRMIQEALVDSANTFSGGAYSGKTSLQAIAIIRGEIDTLRKTLQ